MINYVPREVAVDMAAINRTVNRQREAMLAKANRRPGQKAAITADPDAETAANNAKNAEADAVADAGHVAEGGP